MAAETSFLRSVRPSTLPAWSRASAQAAMSVPAQVRKSLAQMRSPMTSLMCSLMWRRRTLTTLPSSATYWNSSLPGSFLSSRTMRATRPSRSYRACSLPDLPR